MSVISRFLAKPRGTGVHLNIHMFHPLAIIRHFRTLRRDPRYFMNRLSVMAYQVLYPRAPWLTQEAIRIIDGYLKPTMAAWEWGSGKSTPWIARRVGTMVSVEHDPQWHTEVSRWLARASVTNVDYRLLGLGEAYWGAIDDVPADSLDFILIDGEHRDDCIRAAVGKVRPGGLIVVDNAEGHYDLGPLNAYSRRDTCNGVWKTALFFV